MMVESVYPTLQDGKVIQAQVQSSDGTQAQVQSDAIPNFMEDKVKLVQKDLVHYKKIKSKWSVANTTLRTCGISLASLLAAATAATAPLSVPIAIPILLAGVSGANITFAELMIKSFTGKRKRYFREKCDYIKSYLDKMEVLLLKSQVTPTKFKLFQELLKEYGSETRLKSAIKSKDLKKIQKKAKSKFESSRRIYCSTRLFRSFNKQ